MSDLGIDQCGGEAGGMYTREDLIIERDRLRAVIDTAYQLLMDRDPDEAFAVLRRVVRP